MANFDSTSASDTFNNSIPMLEADSACANTVFNEVLQMFHNNDIYLKNTKLDKSGISEKSRQLSGLDVRDEILTPFEYIAKYGTASLVPEFKSLSSLSLTGVSARYGLCLTTVPWGDPSGGLPVQLMICQKGIYARPGTSETVWGSWKTIITF